MTKSAEQYLNSIEALPSEVIIEDPNILWDLVYQADTEGLVVEYEHDRTAGYYLAATVKHAPSGEVEFRLSREATEALGIEWSEG